jgi:hypothetical protein
VAISPVCRLRIVIKRFSHATGLESLELVTEGLHTAAKTHFYAFQLVEDVNCGEFHAP